LAGSESHRCGLLDRLLEQRQGLSDTPGKGIRIAQRRGEPGERKPDVPANFQAPFERRDGFVEISMAQIEMTDSPIRGA
jgi:hypothetical protein